MPNLVCETEAVPRDRATDAWSASVAGDRVVDADLTVVAAGAQGAVARMLGADRVPDEPFGLAIRTYAATPRHADAHLEACLSLRDEHGTPIPGYGWMFPAGDGTVNIGVGALSTMKGFKKLNLNTLLESYRRLVQDDWDLGPNLERPRAWRLPMSTLRRHGPGWVAIGDAAGLVNPMNGEGIDYGLESGMLAADLFLADPATAPARYDELVGERFDAFLRTGRRFSFLIGHPWILQAGPAVVGQHRRDRQHHARRHGQPGRQLDARCGRQGHVARRQVPRPRRPDPAQDPRRRLIRVRPSSHP